MQEAFSGFSPAVQTKLVSISSVCQLLGGNAVFRTRSLKTTYNDSIFHDDKQLCEAQGIAYRLAGSQSTETQEEIFSEQLLTYPSPTTGLLHIQLKSDVESDYHLKVINLTGQVVVEQNHVSSNHTINLAAHNLASGNYIISLTQNSTGNIFRGRIFYEK